MAQALVLDRDVKFFVLKTCSCLRLKKGNGPDLNSSYEIKPSLLTSAALKAFSTISSMATWYMESITGDKSSVTNGSSSDRLVVLLSSGAFDSAEERERERA